MAASADPRKTKPTPPNAGAPPPPPPPLEAQVVVAGAGPAGLVAALLFARAGASVIVLESHADFLRDFRGDTIHPSTLELFSELGWLDEFLRLPHEKARSASATFADAKPEPRVVQVADFSRLGGSVKCPYVAFMPQHVFLDFVDRKAAAFGAGRYRCIRSARATGLIFEGEGEEKEGKGGNEGNEGNGSGNDNDSRRRVVGVRAVMTDGSSGAEFPVRASALVVAADGRRSALRAAARLPPAVNPGGVPPMDVLWFSMPKNAETDPARTGMFASRAAFVVTLDRGSYYQMGLVCPKGGAERVRRAGLPEFARRVAAAVPFLTPERVEQAVPRFFGPDGEGGGGGGEGGGGYGAPGRDIHALDVRVDRLPRWWRPGFICIGDAAHAMSPIGGVGVNLAIQDAVALANALAGKVARGGAAAAGLPKEGEGGAAAAAAAAAAAPPPPYRVADADLAAVQQRRELPTRATQALQVAIQSRVIDQSLQRAEAAAAKAAGEGGEPGEKDPLLPPLPLRIMQRFPALQWVPARLMGIGLRPEHIQCPAAAPAVV